MKKYICKGYFDKCPRYRKDRCYETRPYVGFCVPTTGKDVSKKPRKHKCVQ